VAENLGHSEADAEQVRLPVGPAVFHDHQRRAGDGAGPSRTRSHGWAPVVIAHGHVRPTQLSLLGVTWTSTPFRPSGMHWRCAGGAAQLRVGLEHRKFSTAELSATACLTQFHRPGIIVDGDSQLGAGQVISMMTRWSASWSMAAVVMGRGLCDRSSPAAIFG
jgi:hypothetical protein